jgi:hypothetical protein
MHCPVYLRILTTLLNEPRRSSAISSYVRYVLCPRAKHYDFVIQAIGSEGRRIATSQLHRG